MFDIEYTFAQGMADLKGLKFTSWQKTFIFCKKINDQWIFFRYVYRRIPAKSMNYESMYDYAINDMELIYKT